MKKWCFWTVQLCLRPWGLCDPMDYTVHEILQARILEWVAFPFSRGSSQPRDQTQVSSIAGRFFTSWATREALVADGKVWLLSFIGLVVLHFAWSFWVSNIHRYFKDTSTLTLCNSMMAWPMFLEGQGAAPNILWLIWGHYRLIYTSSPGPFLQ